ncbi:MAG: DUF1643 domain-containing protein [Bacteroidales bacterium]|jgi:hypothetical protein
MARIGRQIPHFKEIDPDSINAGFSTDKVYRYTLDMKYKPSLLMESQREHICVILKNPSSADAFKADATIRKVETYVYKHFASAAKLSILNIFAIRATDAKEVNLLLNRHGKEFITGPENDEAIKHILRQSDHIICAWGNNSGIKSDVYNSRINEIKALIKQQNKQAHCVIGTTPNKQPLHGLMWGFDYQLKPYST